MLCQERVPQRPALRVSLRAAWEPGAHAQAQVPELLSVSRVVLLHGPEAHLRR